MSDNVYTDAERQKLEADNAALREKLWTAIGIIESGAQVNYDWLREARALLGEKP